MTVPHEELIGRHVQGRIEYVEDGQIKVIEVNGRLDGIGTITETTAMVCIGDMSPTPEGGAIHMVPNTKSTVVLLQEV